MKHAIYVELYIIYIYYIYTHIDTYEYESYSCRDAKDWKVRDEKRVRGR